MASVLKSEPVLPFGDLIVPKKITSKLPFSRFKTIEESRDFLLQQRKKAFQSAGKKMYRIETREKKNGYNYEIANGDDLQEIRDHQWRYINQELPALVPEKMTGKDRIYWIISHFTQLALSGGNNLTVPGDRSDDDASEAIDSDPDELGANHLRNESVLSMTSTVAPIGRSKRGSLSNSFMPISLQDAATPASTSQDPANMISPALSTFAASSVIKTTQPVVPTVSLVQPSQQAVQPTVISDKSLGLVSVLLPAKSFLQAMKSQQDKNIARGPTAPLPSLWTETITKYGIFGGIILLVLFNSMCYLAYFEPKFIILISVLVNMIAFTNLHVPPPLKEDTMDKFEVNIPEVSVSSHQQVQSPFQPAPQTFKVTVQAPKESLSLQSVSPPPSSFRKITSQSENAKSSFEDSDSDGAKSPVNNRSSTPPKFRTSNRPLSPEVGASSVPSVSNSNLSPLVNSTAMLSQPPTPSNNVLNKTVSVTSVSNVPVLDINYDPSKLTIAKTLDKADNADTAGDNTYSECAGESWSVRIGPNYAVNRKKAPSARSLCTLLGCDCWASDFKLDNIARYLNLPNVPFYPECESLGFQQPPIFVINCQVPAYAPPNPVWGATKEDGRGYSLVFYYTLLPENIKDWCEVNPKSPAIYLLRKFVSAELDEVKLHERFKAITRIANIQDTKLVGAAKTLTAKYNSTPFLTRPQHKFYRGANYFEIDVDVHLFSYMAKTGLHGVIDALNSVIFDYSFVVEGHDDNELPETILGCVRLTKLNLTGAAEFPVDMVDPAERPNLD